MTKKKTGKRPVKATRKTRTAKAAKPAPKPSPSLAALEDDFAGDGPADTADAEAEDLD